MRARTFRFRGLEQLETRQMLAGDISAALIQDELWLVEAAGQSGLDNAVEIRPLENGAIRVEGSTAADGTRSLINGAAFQDFAAGGASLFVRLGGGRDRLSLGNGNANLEFRTISLDVGIASAAGDADLDSVSINGLYTPSIEILTGASSDLVSLNAEIEGVAIVTGAGDDFVSIRDGALLGNLDIQTYDSLTEVDADTVAFGSDFIAEQISIGGDISVRLGGGADQFLVSDVPTSSLVVGGSIWIDSGNGSDHVAIRRINAGNSPGDWLRIRTGSGVDTVDVSGFTFFNVDIQTAGDADIVRFESASINGDLLVNLGSGADKFFISNPDDAATNSGILVTGSLALDAGAGADRVHIEGSDIDKSLRIDTGDHNDLVNIESTDIGSGATDNLIVNTGAGADEVTVMLEGASFARVTGNLEVQTFKSPDEIDIDRVRLINGNINGSVVARLGAGNDTFDSSLYFIGNDLDLDMGAGADMVALSGRVVDHVIAHLGEGNDVLTLGEMLVYRLLAHGDGGIDSVTGTTKVNGNWPANDPSYRSFYGWEYIDGRRVSDVAHPPGDGVANPKP